MVDVRNPYCPGVAKASGLVIIEAVYARLISDGAAAKGDVMAAARIAGIAAAGNVRGDLIPLPVRARRCQRHLTPCRGLTR